MERLQGPINPWFFEEEEEHLDVECLEQEPSNNTKKLGFGSSYGQQQFQFESPNDGFEQMSMPFLEMLQQSGGGERDSQGGFSPFCELGFQALLSLQQFKKSPWEEEFSHSHHQQPDSCLTHDGALDQTQISAVKSETMDPHQIQNKHSSAIYDGSKVVELMEERAAVKDGGKKRKRVKKTRPASAAKNKEEMESQRMTHIAVERNRRRQMNDHLTAFLSLMPNSYIQRGDQASIIGGAIEYVKELEQLHQSLQAQKRMKTKKKSDNLLLHHQSGGGCDTTASTSTSSSSSSATNKCTNAQCKDIKSETGEVLVVGSCTTEEEEEGIDNNIRRQSCNEFTAEKKSGVVEVHVTVIQNHVSLKVECPRRAGVLLNAIVALEDLGFTVLHLNIMALDNSAHYSFNLKIEEGCEIGSADGIAVVVHQIFSFINNSAA